MSLEKKEDERSVHFTYKLNPDMSSLCQGDILEITDELEDVLKMVHPYFINDQYKYFMVLSQSCDLVRRDGKKCKTPYITLAAVRRYSDFLEKKLIECNYVECYKKLFLMEEKNKERAYQLVERVYNNTEPEYFFLYQENVLNFPESMVAYLKVSIALRSNEHYEKCLKAKKMELTDEFKAKLGWLVGNMYSRVGTSDWDGLLSKKEKIDMINCDLKSMCVIGGKEQLRQLKEKYSKCEDGEFNYDSAIRFISSIQIETKYDKVINIIEDAFQNYGKIPQEEKAKLLNMIKSSHALKSIIT